MWKNSLAKIESRYGAVCYALVGFACAALLPVISARAQGQAANEPGPSHANSSSNSKPQHAPAYQPTTINLQTGRLFGNTKSAARLGPLSLVSLEMFSAYNASPQLAGRPQGTVLGALRGLVVYSNRHEKSSLDFQYLPSLWFSGDKVQTDFIGHDLNFKVHRYLGGRWVLSSSDSFNFKPDRAEVLDSFFSFDPSSGQVSQGPYFDSRRRYLTNSLEITAEYILSPRNNLSFRFEHEIARVTNSSSLNQTTGAAALSGNPLSQQDFRASVGWEHSIGPHRNFAVAYDYDHRNAGDILGVSQSHVFSIGYSQQIRPSLQLQMGFGPGLKLDQTRFGQALVRDRSLIYEGHLTLIKALAKSELALAVSRNNKFAGIIADDLSDRIDASYRRQLTLRWSIALGEGYLRQHLLTATGTSTVTGRVDSVWQDYRLRPTWSVFMSYQRVAGLTFSSSQGAYHVVSGGIRWSAWDKQTARQIP